MAEVWTAVYRVSDGVLLGCGTVLPDRLPDGSATRTYLERPDQGTRWDPSTLDFVPVPAPVYVDRLQDLVNHPYLSSVWSRLTVAQRQQMRRTMVWLLGSRRYREPLEDVAIDPPDSAWPTDPASVTE